MWFDDEEEQDPTVAQQMQTPPKTLPGNFFDQPQQLGGAPPQTLPGNFFDELEKRTKQGEAQKPIAEPQQPEFGDQSANFRREHPILSMPVDYMSGFGGNMFKTAENLQNVGHKWAPGLIPKSQMPEALTRDVPSVAGTLGKVSEEIGEFLLPATKVSKINKGIELARMPWLLEKGAQAGVEGLAAAPIAYGHSGGDPEETKKSAAMAAGTALALPLIGKALGFSTGHTTGAGDYPIERAATNPTPELMAAMRGDITEKEILEATREAIANVEAKRSADYVAQLRKINPNIRVDLTPARRTVNDMLDQFSVRRIWNPHTKRIDLDFGNSSLWSDEAAQGQVRKLFDGIMSPRATDPISVHNLKRGVDAMYRDGKADRAIMEATRQSLVDSLNKSVPNYQKMSADYARASDFLDNLTELSASANNDGTAIRKLAGSLKQNNYYRRDLLEHLAEYTQKDLMGQISGSRLNSWTPRGIVGALHFAGAGGYGVTQAAQHGISGAIHDPVTAAWILAGAFGMSPRVVGELASKAQIAARFGKATAAATPGMLRVTGKQPDYDDEYDSVLGRAQGGPIRLYGGGTSSEEEEDPDEVLRDIERRRLAGSIQPGTIQLGAQPGQFHEFKEPSTRYQPKPGTPELPLSNKSFLAPKTVETREPDWFSELEPPVPKVKQLPASAKDLQIGAQQSAAGLTNMLFRPAESIYGGNLAGGRTLSQAAAEQYGPDPKEVEARQGWQNKGLQFLGGLPLNTVRYGAMTTLAGGNPYLGGFAADVLENSGRDSSPQEAVTAGVAGAALGKLSDVGMHGLKIGGAKILEGFPSKGAFEAAEIAARARLRASGAFEPGMVFGSGPGGFGQNTRDVATLLGAQLGSGVHAVGEAAAARSRQIQALMQEWRDKVLTAPEKEALAKAGEASPDIKEITPFLTPLEAQKMLASPKQVESMSRLLRVLPQSEKMTAMALAGSEKVGWYRGSAQAIQDVFGADAPRFAQLLAATSPRISVEGNLTNSLNIWKNWVAAGRPQDNEAILKIMAKSVQGGGTEKSAMEAWRNNTYAALTSKDPMSLTLSGPKVDSFQHNLRDHVFHVTNDAWMANAYNVAQELFSGAGKNLTAGNPGITTEYAGASARLRQGAAGAGMFPSQGQEAIWSVAMQLYELARKNGIDPREVLQRGMLKPEVIRGTPDFSTLLREPQYLKILDEAGYGDAARAMKPFVFDQAQKANMTPAQQQLLMEAAGTINETMSMRDRDARSKQFAVPKGWEGKIPKATSKSAKSQATREQMIADLYPKKVSGTTNIETIPGATTDHLPEIANLPVSGREHYTSTVYGSQQDLANRDVAQTASGLATMPSRNTQGAYVNAEGQARLKAGLSLRPRDIESHPGRGLPYETDLEWRPAAGTPQQPEPFVGQWKPAMNPQAQADLEGAMAWHAYNNAQEAVGSNALVPQPGEYRAKGDYSVPQEPTMENFKVPLEGKISEERIRRAVREYPQYAFADAGPDIHVLGLYNDLGMPNIIKHTDAVRIQRLLGGESYIPAENVGTYFDIAKKWDNMHGSREVTGEVLGKINQMSPGAYAELDQKVRQVAGDTHKHYSDYVRSKKTTARPDLMNALEIVSKYGLDGLQAAYNNKAFLPGIAMAFLLPPLMNSTADRTEKTLVR